MVRVKTALVSVSDKTGLVEFARGLASLGVSIVSTGGTHKALTDAGIAARQVSDLTGFPEILDGRVKTLHPKVAAGILAVRSDSSHMAQLAQHDALPIDMVVVNLYPFEETASRPGVGFHEVMENIDIGGPTMIRAAAKNHSGVAVVVEPGSYPGVLEELKAGGGSLSEQTCYTLAVKAFRHTAAYDSAICDYLCHVVPCRPAEAAAADVEPPSLLFPDRLVLSFVKGQDLRYGENPHQRAAFYRERWPARGSLAAARQLWGKELSYNNYADADAALALASRFDRPVAVAVKHNNPCGVALASSVAEAFARCREADPVSIFGGIVAVNREVDLACAEAMAALFLEVIMAPSYSAAAFERLARKKDLRLLEIADLQDAAAGAAPGMAGGAAAAAPQTSLLAPGTPVFALRKVSGGILVQEADVAVTRRGALNVVTRRHPTEEELENLLFAWEVVRFVKSNAIVLAKAGTTLGIGAGQMNRVGSVRIAAAQAGPRAEGSAMASDAFFPMADSVEEAARAGVKAIIQPGGSLRDRDSIDACDRFGIAMVFTGVRHFLH